MLCFIDFQFNCGTIDTLRVVEPWAWIRVVEQWSGERRLWLWNKLEEKWWLSHGEGVVMRVSWLWSLGDGGAMVVEL